jgi:alginate O-acetyltransferase complex protein AlgJ
VEKLQFASSELARQMRRFILKLFIFAMIPITANLLIVLLTPITLFTFRSWEALLVYRQDLVKTQFYPNQHLQLVEVGDLGSGTAYAVPKPVTVITDSYGYRYAHPLPDKFDIVIVGDSTIWGASLTQDDMLSETLSRLLQKTVYPYAPIDIFTYLADNRFSAHPPDVVILAAIERTIKPGLCDPRSLIRVEGIGNNNTVRTDSPALQNIAVFADRFLRNNFYFLSFIRSRFEVRKIIANASGMLFLAKSIPMLDIAGIDQVVSEIQACNTLFEKKGIKFIFLPIPDKEDVYFDTIPAAYRDTIPTSRSEFLNRLTAALIQKGIAVVPTEAAFLEARAKGIQLYQLDDTHWNPAGVQLTATLIQQMLSVHH